MKILTYTEIATGTRAGLSCLADVSKPIESNKIDC